MPAVIEYAVAWKAGAILGGQRYRAGSALIMYSFYPPAEVATPARSFEWLPVDWSLYLRLIDIWSKLVARKRRPRPGLSGRWQEVWRYSWAAAPGRVPVADAGPDLV